MYYLHFSKRWSVLILYSDIIWTGELLKFEYSQFSFIIEAFLSIIHTTKHFKENIFKPENRKKLLAKCHL